jgi:drug/metabolite transporter (DMT)-like permease
VSPRQWLLLLVTAASFASSILVNKVLTGQLPPFTLAAARALLAAPVCLLVLQLTGRSLPRGADLRTIVYAGVGVIVIPYCALALGQRTISGGLSGILYSTMPLFTLLAAHLVLHDERMGLRKLAGIALGVAGVVAVIGPSLLDGLGAHALAELITLCGPLAYAIGTVLMRRSRHIDAIALTAGMFVASAAILVPVALLLEHPWQLRPATATGGWLLVMVVFGTILPAALNYLLVQRVGATRASVAMFLMPLIAVVVGSLLMGERLQASAFVGMALILGGSLIVNGLGGGGGSPASPAPAPGGTPAPRPGSTPLDAARRSRAASARAR